MPFNGEPRFSAPKREGVSIALAFGTEGATGFTLVHALHSNNATHVAIERLFICRILDVTKGYLDTSIGWVEDIL